MAVWPFLPVETETHSFIYHGNTEFWVMKKPHMGYKEEASSVTKVSKSKIMQSNLIQNYYTSANHTSVEDASKTIIVFLSKMLIFHWTVWFFVWKNHGFALKSRSNPSPTSPDFLPLELKQQVDSQACFSQKKKTRKVWFWRPWHAKKPSQVRFLHVNPPGRVFFFGWFCGRFSLVKLCLPEVHRTVAIHCILWPGGRHQLQ